MLKRNALLLFFISYAIIGVFAADPKGLGREYNPVISPEEFTTIIDNPYFPLIPGTVTISEGVTDEGTEIIILEVTRNTKKVMGVACVVVRDRVWANGKLVEDTDDWYAQDSDGNVWYLGEISKEYKDGKIVSYEGSWEAGVDGAIPGIIIHGKPEIGILYYQEYWEGVAEDMAEVIALNETVTTPYGIYKKSLKIKEWNPLERGSREIKYFAPGIGFVMEEAGLEKIYFKEYISENEVDAYISEIESRDYPIPLGLEVSLKAGVDAVNTDEKSFFVQPGINWEIHETGLSLGAEWEIPLSPDAEIGAVTLSEEYEYELEDYSIILFAGNENIFELNGKDQSEGMVYLGSTFIELVTLSFNYIYIPDIELGSEVTLGFEFYFGKIGILGMEGTSNIILYESPGFGDIEFDINYSWLIKKYTLTAGVEPVIELEKINNEYKSELIITPYLIGAITF